MREAMAETRMVGERLVCDDAERRRIERRRSEMSKMLVPRLERGQDDDDGVLENCPRVDKMFLKYAMESKEWRELEE